MTIIDGGQQLRTQKAELEDAVAGFVAVVQQRFQSEQNVGA